MSSTCLLCCLVCYFTPHNVKLLWLSWTRVELRVASWSSPNEVIGVAYVVTVHSGDVCYNYYNEEEVDKVDKDDNAAVSRGEFAIYHNDDVVSLELSLGLGGQKNGLPSSLIRYASIHTLC